VFRVLYKIRHGSEDSIDEDFYYVVDRMPSKEEAVKFQKENSDDVNFIRIVDGKVVECWKGLPDEINNSIYHTFHLHPQEVPDSPISAPVPRDKFYKASQVVRELLARASRTHYRSEIKAALKSGSLSQRMSVLGELDLTMISDFQKYPKEDVYKFFAQQIGMLFSLLRGEDALYTKRSILQAYPLLEGYLYRRESDPSNLQHMLTELVGELDAFFRKVVVAEEGQVVTARKSGRPVRLDVRYERYFSD